MSELFKLIFAETDNIYITDLNAEFGHSRPSIIKNTDGEARNFFCINPLKSNIRRKSEIAAYRNFLVEDDSTPIDTQLALMPKLASLGMIAGATFSGGKSIHYIVSCSDDLQLGEPGSDSANEKYRAIWLGIAKILSDNGINVDSSNKNPAGLSRMPGSYRGNVQQTLVYTGNLVSSEFLQSLAVNTVRKPKTVSNVDIASLEQLETVLNQIQHSNLRMYLRHPTWVNEHAGNYHSIFKIACWAIDELGLPLNLFESYFAKYTLTFLLKAKYYKDWQKPIYDAYKHKGLL